MKKAFTLTEVLIVVIIVGILVSLSVPLYRKAVSKGRDREAKAMLRLIHAAEKIYRLEVGFYASCGTASGCNDALDLDIPIVSASTTSSAWSYNVETGTARRNRVRSFCAEADGGGGEVAKWSMIPSDTDAQPNDCNSRP